MKQPVKSDSILKITLNLTAASVLAGAIIAAVYTFTKPYSDKNREEQKNSTKQMLIPGADEFAAVSGKQDWFCALKHGKPVAYVISAQGKGYGGEIKMLVAVDMQMRLIAYKILSHNETPGFGDRAELPEFSGQFRGKRAENMEVVKIHDDAKIDAITGATITSRAVTDAVKKSLLELDDYLKNTGGVKP